MKKIDTELVPDLVAFCEHVTTATIGNRRSI